MERKKGEESKGGGSKEKYRNIYECFSCHSETIDLKTSYTFLIFDLSYVIFNFSINGILRIFRGIL